MTDQLHVFNWVKIGYEGGTVSAWTVAEKGFDNSWLVPGYDYWLYTSPDEFPFIAEIGPELESPQ